MKEETQPGSPFSTQDLLKLALEHPTTCSSLLCSILFKDFLKVLEAEKEPRSPDHTISERCG